MANVDIRPFGSAVGGTLGTYQDGVNANDDYYVPNNGAVRLVVDSVDLSSADQRDMTIETFGVVGPNLAVADQVERLATANGRLQQFGPFTPALYNNSDGELHITFSDTDSDIRFGAIYV